MAAMSRRAPTALFAGGGTAGHVFPALAVAEELIGRGWGVRFAGGEGGIEARLVAAKGWPFDVLPARPLVGRNPLSQTLALATVARSTLAAARLIRRRGVGVVVGTGGYVSAPAVLGARLAGRPSLLIEPNAAAGVANRWLSRWASAAAVGYPASGEQLRCPAWVTGVPVRGEFHRAAEARPAAAGPLGLLVLGGSRGSRQLNLAVPAALGALAAAAARQLELAVLHQAGPERVDEATAAYRAAGFTPSVAEVRSGDDTDGGEIGVQRTPGAVKILPFLDDVAATMAASHLIVSRAGAITTAEICAAGRASLLVPLALAGGHQSDNARRLAEAGAAVVVSSHDLEEAGATAGAGLAAPLAALLADRERLAAMGRAARALARPDAAAAIADRVEALATDDRRGAAA